MKEDDDHHGDPDPEARPLRLDGELDLHPFPPSQVKDLVRDWLAECRAAGLLEVRIIHGKGIGALRTTVHAVLDRLEWVRSYRLAGDRSGWGATIVRLDPPGED